MAINSITTRYGKIKAFHTEDRVKVKFMPGVFNIEPDEYKRDGDFAAVILTPRELLDLINLLSSQYEYVRPQYEFGYEREGD